MTIALASKVLGKNIDPTDMAVLKEAAKDKKVVLKVAEVLKPFAENAKLAG